MLKFSSLERLLRWKVAISDNPNPLKLLRNDHLSRPKFGACENGYSYENGKFHFNHVS